LTTTPFAGGAGAVAAIDFDTVIGERRYQGIVIPSSYATNLTALSDYLTSVYNVTNMIKNGVGFACYAAASGSAAVTFANPFNNKSLVVFSDEVIATNDQRGGYIVEYNPVIACEFAAIRALRMTPNANIAQYLVGNNIANTTGGVYRAALPYHQTPFIDLPVVVKGRGWSFADQTLLNSNGVSFLGNNAAASAVVCGDVVTTYRDADGTFKYLNTVDTISAVREFFFNQCQQQFAQSVLTDGDLTGPNTINNAQSIRAYLGNLYQILAGRDFGLCQAGAAAQRFFNDNLQVEVIMLTGTVNITAVVPIVSQMRGINGTIQLTFNI
jgi:phage tail sheath gpL-like